MHVLTLSVKLITRSAPTKINTGHRYDYSYRSNHKCFWKVFSSNKNRLIYLLINLPITDFRAGKSLVYELAIPLLESDCYPTLIYKKNQMFPEGHIFYHAVSLLQGLDALVADPIKSSEVLGLSCARKVWKSGQAKFIRAAKRLYSSRSGNQSLNLFSIFREKINCFRNVYILLDYSYFHKKAKSFSFPDFVFFSISSH